MTSRSRGIEVICASCLQPASSCQCEHTTARLSGRKGSPSNLDREGCNMRVVNKLTKPGDIRRVDLMPDTVRVQMADGRDRIYRLTSEYCVSEGGRYEPEAETGVAGTPTSAPEALRPEHSA